MKTLQRKTRSDKFPLTLHKTGQYCKKIRGKIYYFGSNKKDALQKYLDQSTYLHGHHDDVQYVQDVYAQTDRVIENSRKFVCTEKS